MPLKRLYILGMVMLGLIGCLCWIQLKLIRKNYEATSFYYHQKIKEAYSRVILPVFSTSLTNLNIAVSEIIKNNLADEPFYPKEKVAKQYYANDSIGYHYTGDSISGKNKPQFTVDVRLCRLPVTKKDRIARVYVDSIGKILQQVHNISLQSAFRQSLERDFQSENIRLALDLASLTLTIHNTDYPIVEAPVKYTILEERTKAQQVSVFDSSLSNIMGVNFQMHLKAKVIWQDSHYFFLYQNKEMFFLFILINFLLIILCLTAILFIKKQRKLEQQKDDFINNVTHEFKTPIATLTIAASSLLKTEIQQRPEEINYLAGLINRQTSRLQYFFNEILTASITGNPAERKEVAVHEILLQDIETIKIKYQDIPLELVKNFTKGNPAVYISIDELHTVFMNIFDNAFKYVNTLPLVLNVVTKYVNGLLVVEINDNGQGIADANLPNVFKKFYRGDSDATHHIGGLGLGLYNAKRIADANGFRIYLTSTYGKGTTVSIQF